VHENTIKDKTNNPTGAKQNEPLPSIPWLSFTSPNPRLRMPLLIDFRYTLGTKLTALANEQWSHLFPWL
jgi:hypothetical protein